MTTQKLLQQLGSYLKELTVRIGFPVYNSGGEIASPKVWVGTTTSASGAWTVNYASASFTSPPEVIAFARATTTNVYDHVLASGDGTPTTTTCSGYALRGANLLAVGPTVRTAPDGTVITVIAIGT